MREYFGLAGGNGCPRFGEVDTGTPGWRSGKHFTTPPNEPATTATRNEVKALLKAVFRQD
jgi:hypothetical protein